MDTIALAFKAIMTLTAASHPTEEEAFRYYRIAQEFAEVAHTHPIGTEKETVLILTAVAFHESGLSEEVETCEVRGDGGRSITMFQLQRPAWGDFVREELCRDNKLAAERAADLLSRYGSIRRAFNAYASGNPDLESGASRDTFATYSRLRTKFHVRGIKGG